MTQPDPRAIDLSAVASRTVAEATAIPPDDLPNDPRAHRNRHDMTAYLERGRPVRLLAKFRLPSKACPSAACPPWLHWHTTPRGGPRNALVQRADGERVVRPFRGLRRPT